MGVSADRIKMIEKAAPTCGDHLVAFFPKVAGQPPQTSGGTGTLVSIGQDSFLITASHVVERFAGETPWIPFVDSGFDGEAATILEECQFSGRTNPHDIAVIRLAPEVAKRFNKKKFFPISKLDPFDNVDSGTCEYLILGFPQVWRTFDPLQKEMSATFLPFGTVPFPGSTQGLLEFDPTIHFLVMYPSVDVWDNNNRTSFLPDPSGISGSAVWRMRAGNQKAENFSDDWLRLVGIEHGIYRDQGILKSTKVKYVIALIYREYPHLREILKNEFPHFSWDLE